MEDDEIEGECPEVDDALDLVNLGSQMDEDLDGDKSESQAIALRPKTLSWEERRPPSQPEAH